MQVRYGVTNVLNMLYLIGYLVGCSICLVTQLVKKYGIGKSFIYSFVIPVVEPQPSPPLDATMWNWEVFFNCFALLYKQFSMVGFGGS